MIIFFYVLIILFLPGTWGIRPRPLPKTEIKVQSLYAPYPSEFILFFLIIYLKI